MMPLLLMIPGMTNTPGVWDLVRRHLTAEVEVRVTDLRASDGIAAMAAYAWQALDGVEASRPLAIAGYSMGGHVALQMLATAPRPVQALALLCTSARPEDPADAPMRERAIASAQRDWGRYVHAIANHLVTPTGRANDELFRAILADLHDCGAEATISQHRAAASRPDNRMLLPTLRLHALVMAGAADPRIALASAREVADAIPGAEWIEVADGGHLLPWEHPELVSNAMDQWLRKIHSPRP